MTTIKVYYKYNANQSFFEEVFEHLTEDQVQKIEKRYSDNMKNGDYIALTIKMYNEEI